MLPVYRVFDRRCQLTSVRRERIKLRAEPESPDLQYMLDGQSLGRPSANVLWKAQCGEHTLQLRSEQNAVLESASFTVR